MDISTAIGFVLGANHAMREETNPPRYRGTDQLEQLLEQREAAKRLEIANAERLRQLRENPPPPWERTPEYRAQKRRSRNIK